MCRTLGAKLVLPALAAFSLSCDAQQSTSPSARNALASGGASSSKSGSIARNTTIVLIHGAWADGTGWEEIIPILLHDGIVDTTVLIGA